MEQNTIKNALGMHRKQIIYTRAQRKRTTTAAQTLVPLFVAVLTAFVATGKIVSVGFGDRDELV